MIHILDTSAAMEIVLNRSEASFYSERLMKSDWVIAPDLFVSEITNVFWKYHQFENLPLDICERTLEMSLDLVDDFISAQALYKEAFALACLARHSVYDMMYLVLARRHNGILLTVDHQLIQIADKYAIRVERDS